MSDRGDHRTVVRPKPGGTHQRERQIRDRLSFEDGPEEDPGASATPRSDGVRGREEQPRESSARGKTRVRGGSDAGRPAARIEPPAREPAPPRAYEREPPPPEPPHRPAQEARPRDERPGFFRRAATGFRSAEERSGGDSHSTHSGGNNLFLRSAAPVLEHVTWVRQLETAPDLVKLRADLIECIGAFREQLRPVVEERPLKDVSYSLCALIDEAIASSEWGAETDWNNHGMQMRFHNSNRGGEHFFKTLDRAVDLASLNLEYLEFAYVCLSLGLKGQYAEGAHELRNKEEDLYEVIRQRRGSPDVQLSRSWSPATAAAKRHSREMPAWAALAVSALLLFATYLGFKFALSAQTDPIYERLRVPAQDQVLEAELADAVKLLEVDEPRVRVETLDLGQLLAEERARGLVELRSDGRTTTIVLRGDPKRGVALFRSGSADVRSEFLPLIAKIASVLDDVEGPIRITGHTDSLPTVVIPSNYVLSTMRAEAVRDALAPGLRDGDRIAVEGLADERKIEDPDDTPAKRARNRRVEIEVRGKSALERRSGTPLAAPGLGAQA